MRYVPDIVRRVYDRTPVWSRSAASSLYGFVKQAREDTARFRQFLRELERTQTWTRSRLEDLQGERLRTLVSHAARRVPYYRSLFSEHGISAGQIQTPDDLCRIPLLTKETLRTRQADLLAEGTDVSSLRSESTSGTTGTPLTVFIDDDTYLWHRAAQWLHHRWAGYTHREWIGIFAGYRVLPASRSRPPFWVTNVAGRQIHFSTYHLNPRWIAAYIRKIRSTRLRFLLGYPSAIGVLAKEILALGETVPLQAIFLSSEPVYSWQKDAMREAFGAALCYYYGSTERVLSAGSCLEQSEGGWMHVAMEIGLAEIVRDPTIPDQELVVGTSLTNLTMPLIRYGTGDVTTRGNDPCRCGRAHQLLGPIATRTADMLVTPAGSIISPWLVTRVFSAEKTVRAFQIVQHGVSSLTVKVVPAQGFGPAVERRLRTDLLAQMGPGMSVQFETVADIERTSGGKVRVVKSEISSPPREERGAAHGG